MAHPHFLHALGFGGEVLSYHRQDVSIHTPMAMGELVQSPMGGELFVEVVEALAFDGRRWFKGRIKVFDNARPKPPRPAPAPTPPEPLPRVKATALGPGVPDPLRSRTRRVRRDFAAAGPFEEINQAEAVRWFYENVGWFPASLGADRTKGEPKSATRLTAAQRRNLRCLELHEQGMANKEIRRVVNKEHDKSGWGLVMSDDAVSQYVRRARDKRDDGPDRPDKT